MCIHKLPKVCLGDVVSKSLENSQMLYEKTNIPYSAGIDFRRQNLTSVNADLVVYLPLPHCCFDILFFPLTVPVNCPGTYLSLTYCSFPLTVPVR